MPKAKLEYESEDDPTSSKKIDDEQPTPLKINVKVANDVITESTPTAQDVKPTKPLKEKKPRSQAQIDTTNRMREMLKKKREQDVILREQARLEHEEFKKKVKKKLFSERVKDKVKEKIKEITEYETDSDVSDEAPKPSPIVRKTHSEARQAPAPRYKEQTVYAPPAPPKHRVIFF